MEDDSVAEVRGIEPNQNLEDNMTDITKEKVKNLPAGREYEKKTDNMKQLTDIYNKLFKQENNLKDNIEDIELTSQELRFLYEIDNKIKGFGYGKDLRIQRNLDNNNLSIISDMITIDNDITLPNNLTINSSYRDFNNVKFLPDNLTVNGYFDLSSSDIESLPDNLTVKGDLDLGATKLTSLPDNLTVNGDLSLSYNPLITSLPDNLTVEGDLILFNKKITSLPESLIVKGRIIRDMDEYHNSSEDN